MIDNNEQFKKEMTDLQAELQKGLKAMLNEIGNKLKNVEKEAIKKEVIEIDELLERLKTGLIWLALFGKVSSGKSALTNALMGIDIAKVGIQHDLTDKPHPYVKEPWCIVDVPGIMGKKVNEQTALEEARKAHGHIFVIDAEPLGDEIELFDLVLKNSPNTPRIIFFNKLDTFEHRPQGDLEIVKELVYKKMMKYVKTKEDIVFGSAQIFDRGMGIMVRQKLPLLEDRLYSDTSTLGSIMNIIDPANRASELSNDIKSKIIETRKKVARKIISSFALGEVASSFVPFGEILVAPGLLATLTYSLVKIMGEKENENFDKFKAAKDILRVCGEYLTVEFIGVAIVDTIADFLGFGFGGVLLDLVGVSYFKYRRTLIFGEAVLLYIENNFSFGKDPKTIILEAKEAAKSKYENFKNK